MTILDQLSTNDCLSRMGMIIDTSCNLCNSSQESRDHLFFSCPYSIFVWEHILHLCRLHRQIRTWNQELLWALENLKGKSLIVVILKIAWNAHIYHVWQERNHRQFRGVNRSIDDTVRCIVDSVRFRIHGRV
ncbi:hypothetical protein GQ457_05G034820 [Hibiscus cannabinus]